MNSPTSSPRETHWRRISELAEQQGATPEFAPGVEVWEDGPSRRRFMQIMGASFGLAGAAGCDRQPAEQIIPYVTAPKDFTPGDALYFASAIVHDGAASGVLIESHMGRPIKVEGNPLHPAVPEIMANANAQLAESNSNPPTRFGPSSSFAQASLLSLYDPDRSQTVLRNGAITTWTAFQAMLAARTDRLQADGGQGLRILSPPVNSPTLAAQRDQLLAAFPAANWHEFSPVGRENIDEGCLMAFGEPLTPRYDLSQADVIVSLDANFLVEGPECLRDARSFADGRRMARPQGEEADPTRPEMNRLYVLEVGSTLTGAAADHRLAVTPADLEKIALAMVAKLGLEYPPVELDERQQQWVEVIAEDLQNAGPGRSLVLCGRRLPPALQALSHWINAELQNVGKTVSYHKNPFVDSENAERAQGSLQELTEAMSAGEVELLVMLGGNPVYDAPSDLGFAKALSKVGESVHLGAYFNETAAQTQWHIPQTHWLEAWGDARAADGTASLGQPLIEPMYKGKSAHEVVAALLGEGTAKSYDLVRAHWQQVTALEESSAEFEGFWQSALHDGVVPETAFPTQTPTVRPEFAAELRTGAIALGNRSAADWTLAFSPDASVWDGEFANNAWLQELPRPFSKITWDNAALIAPADAEKLAIEEGDVLEITVGSEQMVRLPAWVLPGQPTGVIGLQLGYGRTHAGRVGTGVGVDIYPLRQSDSLWFSSDAQVTKTDESRPFATTQEHHRMEDRHLVRAGSLEEFQAHPEHPEFVHPGHHGGGDTSLFETPAYEGQQWGMTIDLGSCIGCNGCTIACQAENNIPSVGRDEVARAREMHWIRIDHYYEGSVDDPQSVHQPVMCQHCELAPCEIVCPVAATTHSDEGLNEMTYNRCVGTRYCSNNCPYKVRRFNFFDYQAEMRDTPSLQLLANPEVTVRSRGVMEKCTFCVQRISSARITAEKERRDVRDGEIVTACQAACPTQAIRFGNINDQSSEVAQLNESPLSYHLLEELNARPRVTYLAEVRNPNPKLAVMEDA